ncbi:LexA/Signal peptidase, partial [Amniculicola lignicola CBS 123094]
WHFFTKYFYELVACSGISMLPTIPHWHPRAQHPWLLTSKLYRRGHNIKVGDIVIYVSPDTGGNGCKRVVGMPGDYVCVLSPPKENKDLDDEEFVGGRVGEDMFRVPEGHCWLVGDNLQWSRDSRVYGPVPLALIKGKVLGYVVPFSDAAWFRNGVAEAGEHEPPVVTKVLV